LGDHLSYCDCPACCAFQAQNEMIRYPAAVPDLSHLSQHVWNFLDILARV
jgi:hypothetical protein